ncbi:putative xylitol dehydrogenase protein [Phaeoacremonium minimum UCRPA7]|uniref:D-xylulose reductase n=1 Tax=Phaeoacremonium minimum (strain UCR-PA7) TaxID=1286976 RepID=R8BNQ3_PHAM7|nr:putative xylitol dehydrogenase protein [Phaeoacremonium minimum UCRPA7]EOO01033.1 putative xylitol dehydrogenase protein [Phaeoacremonium minimum UCRPA7]
MDAPLPTSNRAVVWAGARKLEIQQRPVVPPSDTEVLVEIVATGICGSDCHNWESDKVSRQLVLGHESSGVIIKVGKDVKDRTVGQRVAVEPGFACMDGCGPLGLLILAVAKAYGLKKIVMFDIEESRTKFAESYGADVGIVTPKNSDPSKDSLTFSQEYAKEIVDKYELGQGFDVTVEASGAEICAQMAICMLKSGGTCIQAGLGKPLTSVPLFLLTARELNIKGTVRYTPGCFADAISLLARKKVDLRPLITSTYPLTEAGKAFEAQHARKDIKIVIMNQK